MRRAGGWVLGILVVAGMAGGSYFAFRRVFNRETVTVVFVEEQNSSNPRIEALQSGFRFALNEAAHGAGRFRVQAAFDTDYYGYVQVPAPSGGPADVLNRWEDPKAFAWIGTGGSPLNATRSAPAILWCSSDHSEDEELKPRYCLAPSLQALSRGAARWAKKRGATRVRVVTEQFNDANLYVTGSFAEEARTHGLELVGQVDTFQVTPSIAEDILAETSDFVLFVGEADGDRKAVEIFKGLKDKGYQGDFVALDSSWDYSLLGSPRGIPDGILLVSPTPPPPPEFVATYQACTGVPPSPRTYIGYRAGRVFLEALGQPGVVDRTSLRAALDTMPDFNGKGASTSPCAAYVSKNGAFEFLEFIR